LRRSALYLRGGDRYAAFWVRDDVMGYELCSWMFMIPFNDSLLYPRVADLAFRLDIGLEVLWCLDC